VLALALVVLVLVQVQVLVLVLQKRQFRRTDPQHHPRCSHPPAGLPARRRPSPTGRPLP
jgi:hypothetical protein